MVTQQQETSTPMQDWVAQALDRMQPILDGTGVDQLNNHFWEHGSHAHKEMITDVLERVEWLAQHFKVMPEPSTARCEGSIALDHDCECLCWQAGGIAALTNVVERMEAWE